MFTAEVLNILIPAIAALIGYWLRHKGIQLPFFDVPKTPSGTPGVDHPLLSMLELIQKIQEALKGLNLPPSVPSNTPPK